MPYQHSNEKAELRPAAGKGKRRRVRLFMLILLGFMVWAGFTIIRSIYTGSSQGRSSAGDRAEILRAEADQ